MAVGDHIYVRRPGYTHHGVEVEQRMVVHFTGNPRSKRGATIRKDTLEVFAQGAKVRVRRYEECLEAQEVVRRAEAKIGQSGYNLYANNCEHFARWCLTDRHMSAQVNGVRATSGIFTTIAAAAAGGVGVITAAGSVAGVSASGIMSGLAAAGGVVGSGAVGGLVVLGSGPGIVSAALMNRALRDDPALPKEERSARRVGRRSSIAGAATGGAAGVAAVNAGGVVAGLSAAGISSGLAAIGAVAGGGMVAGSVIVISAPAVAVVGVSYGTYRVARLWKQRGSESEQPPEPQPCS